MEEGGRGKTPRSTSVSTLCLRCGPRTPNSQQNAAGVAPSPTAGGRLNCSPDGCSETIMLARGFTVEQMLELVHARDNKWRARGDGCAHDRGSAGEDHGGGVEHT